MADETKQERSEAQQNADFSSSQFYYDDEFIYPQYVEAEAELITVPLESDLLSEENSNEENESIPAEAKKERKKLSFKDIVNFAIDAVYTVGDETIELFRWIIGKTGPFVLLPFAIAFTLASSLFKKIKSTVHLVPSSLKEEFENAENPSKGFYARVIFKRLFSKKRMLKLAANLAFPLVALVFVAAVYGGVRNTVFALEVIYNGKSIGYIEDEEVFYEGRNQALTLLSSGIQENENQSLVAQPVYKVKRVNVNDLSNSDMISEEIILTSDTTYIRACGIYIDGAFLCAVKNESDALTVFESLLEPYINKNNSSENVAFVEEIQYIQGLYPENSELIWSSTELMDTLKNAKKAAVYHRYKQGDTARTIAKKYGITVAQLKALNPKIKNFSTLKENKRVLVSREENYVRVKVMKTRSKTQLIPFETVKKNSSSLAKGTSKTTQNGVNGKKTITELVTYIDGKESYTTVVSEKITKAPVNKIILVGTKTYTAASSGFTWPTRGAYSISSYYGYRNPNISGWSFHGGLDIVRSGGGTSGTPVVAAASGTVEVAYSGYSGYGHTVVINHGNGIKTRYAHMYPGSITVRAGQKVSIGQQIGRIGSTGNSTGPHLHFEVLVNGSKVNPLKYIR